MYSFYSKTAYKMLYIGISNDNNSPHEQQKLSGKLVKSPVQDQRWIWTTAIIVKPVIRDEKAR